MFPWTCPLLNFVRRDVRVLATCLVFLNLHQPRNPGVVVLAHMQISSLGIAPSSAAMPVGQISHMCSDRLPGASAISQMLPGHVKPEAHVLARWSVCAQQIQHVQDVLDSLHVRCQAVQCMCTYFCPGNLVRKYGSPIQGTYLSPITLTNEHCLYGSAWERGMCRISSFETRI